MPLLSNIERRAIERTRKQTQKQDIIKLLQVRFGNISENLVENMNKIDDKSLLKQFFISAISVNCVEDFQQLINSNLSESD